MASIEITKLANPATLPTSQGMGVSFSTDGVYMSVVTIATSFIYIYKRSGDTFTKLANPDVLPTGVVRGVVFSPDGLYMSVVTNDTPFVFIYKRNGDSFTKLANPATLPTGAGRSVSFSPDGVYMSVTHTITPFITIYKRSGDTFTKLDNPATLPTAEASSVVFSPDGTYMGVGYTVSPYIIIYKQNGDIFTKLPDPSVLPTGSGLGVAFSPDGVYMSVSHATTPFITIYKRSGDTFTKLDNPDVLPTGIGNGVAFSTDGDYMTLGLNVTPFIFIYKRSGDIFTKLPNPSVLPTGAGNGVALFTEGNSTYMSVAHTTTPYVTIYKVTKIYFNKFLLLSSSGEVESIVPETYSSNLIPTMTSNTAPSGVASASTIYSTTYDAWQAFDNTFGATSSNNSWTSNTANGGWLAYEFATSKIINKYKIYSRQDALSSNSPKDFTFEGWDGSQWIVLDTRIGVINWTSEGKEFTFENSVSYKKYRVNITATILSTQYVSIGELQMMEKMSNKLIKSTSTQTEQDFINHGIDSLSSIDPKSNFSKKQYIKAQNTALGSGKTFEQPIDLARYKVKKITFQ